MAGTAFVALTQHLSIRLQGFENLVRFLDAIVVCANLFPRLRVVDPLQLHGRVFLRYDHNFQSADFLDFVLVLVHDAKRLGVTHDLPVRLPAEFLLVVLPPEALLGCLLESEPEPL